MFDDRDISREKAWYYEERAKKAIANLEKYNVIAHYVPNQKEALPLIMGMIPEGVTVARSDSITIEQIGFLHELKKRNKNKFIDPFARDDNGQLLAGTEEEFTRILKEALLADVYLTGTNAVTMDGKLINIDGRGNRVAAHIYGPNKVIFVTGANKITKDIHEGLEMIRQYSAPMNVMRHVLKHHRPELAELPCAKTGRCMNCTHEWSICRYTVIIEGCMLREKGRLNVVIIGESLGI